jgi:ketosteroid isomerase-like protein
MAANESSRSQDNVSHGKGEGSDTTSLQPVVLPNNASKLLRTAWSILDGYNQWSLDAILAPRTPDCIQKVYPMSLQGPIYTGPEAYREYYKTMIPLFRNFKLEVLDYSEDNARNRVFFHARCTAETDIDPYANEFVWMIRTTGGQDMVEDIKEFVDSAYTVEYLKKMWEKMQEQGKTMWG